VALAFVDPDSPIRARSSHRPRGPRRGWPPAARRPAGIPRSAARRCTGRRLVHGEADAAPASWSISTIRRRRRVRRPAAAFWRRGHVLGASSAAPRHRARLAARERRRTSASAGVISASARPLRGDPPAELSITRRGAVRRRRARSQKTGFFLDQRDNAARSAATPRPRPAQPVRLHGSFSLHARWRRGPRDLVDIAPGDRQLEHNLALSGLPADAHERVAPMPSTSRARRQQHRRGPRHR